MAGCVTGIIQTHRYSQTSLYRHLIEQQYLLERQFEWNDSLAQDEEIIRDTGCKLIPIFLYFSYILDQNPIF